MPDVDLDMADDDAPPANLPYARSGTQIWEEGDKDKKEELKENIEEPVNLEDMWDEYEKDTNFFKAIEIAKDGGFSEVDELVGTMRYVFGGMAVGFVFLNVYSIVSVNLGLILGDSEDIDIFLVTKEYILKPLGYYDFVGKDLVIIGTLEISLIIWSVLKLCWWGFQMRCPAGGEEMRRWQAVQEFFWNVIPEASTISAVKMLNWVVPAVLFPEATKAYNASWDDGKVAWFGKMMYFLFSRCVYLLVGFDAFLFKLQTVAFSMQEMLKTGAEATSPPDPTASPSVSASNEGLYFGDVVSLSLLAISFMNQILGIVQLSWFVRMRIFSFIFAGEDGQLSEQEEALKETWESMLAQRIWRDLPPKQALAAYLSYSDYDFQKLALETVKPGHEKPKRASKQNVEGVELAEAPTAALMPAAEKRDDLE